MGARTRENSPSIELTKTITTPYFPSGARYITVLLMAVAVYLAVESHPVWAALLIAICLVILATRYVTLIDLGAKRYNEYVSVGGLKFGNESQSFERLHRIVITKKNYSQTMNSRVQSSVLRYSEYTGTLHHDERGRLDLLILRDKDDLVRDLKQYVEFLKVNIEDRSA